MLSLLRRKPKVESILEDSKVPLGFHGYENPNTPDIAALEMHALQLIFVPDEFRQGAKKHDMVGAHSVGLGEGYTREKFSFFKKRVENDVVPPVLVPLPDLRTHRQRHDLTKPTSWFNDDYARIRGELWAIRPYQIKELDTYKGNRVQFLRKRITVIFPYREIIKKTFPDGTYEKITTGEQIYLLQAWMYVGIPDYWNSLIDAGFFFNKVPQFKSNKKWMDRYYEYKP